MEGVVFFNIEGWDAIFMTYPTFSKDIYNPYGSVELKT